ncbi:MAG TPA: MATE family efflux transporter [Clostridia bacterium]|jgi:putative MATE family efflux protein|nr:MATE family efflux transporter [Clostridia bacterium]
MSMKRVTDFTEGSIPRHLIIFALPMFLGNLLQAFYNIIDSIWVGRFLGHQAFAAISVSFPVIFVLIALIIGITMGTTTLVGQYYGAKKNELVSKTISNSLLLLLVFGSIISLAGVIFSRRILLFINAPLDVLDMAADYLKIFSSGLLGMFLYNGISGILRGLGDSRTPLKFLFYATILNLILDPFFIFGLGPFPRLEVRGAALATIIAQGISALISLRYLFVTSGLVKIKSEFWKIDFKIVKLIFKIGLPAGLQHVFISLSSLLVSSIVNSFGSTIVAGFGAGATIDQFAFMPAMSLGMAVSSLVAQNLGAGKNERVQESVYWSSLITLIITLLISLAAFFIPQLLLFPFTTDPGVIAAGSRYLHYLSFAYIPMALMFTLGGVLRGAGDTFIAMLFTLISLWTIRIPLARYLSQIPTLGIEGVWIGIAVSPLIGLLLNYLYYRSQRWKKSIVNETN